LLAHGAELEVYSSKLKTRIEYQSNGNMEEILEVG
jgi:hypothetical protein